jgi:hypothetical protein
LIAAQKAREDQAEGWGSVGNGCVGGASSVIIAPDALCPGAILDDSAPASGHATSMEKASMRACSRIA